MAGATRSRAAAAGKPPITQNNGNASAPQFEQASQDSVSHLSEGLHPIHLNEASEHPHEASQELNRLGVHVKDVLSTIHSLEGLDLQHQRIPLPKIVVLGEQSTGKSSVIESISGIKTPRSTGTCTRCPLFIQLGPPSDPHAPWKASVTLRRLFDYDGKTGRPKERRYPGWVLRSQPKSEQFMSTTNRSQLEYIIKQAQLAVISPLVDCKEFLKPSTAHIEDLHQCRFSPNVVCITIEDLELPNLSFYDLPGIVGQAEDPLEVNFVRNLVIEYVKDPEALILVTCAMDNDIANSTAGGIAREMKATDRCIGVLTKPDLITETASQEKLREIFIEKRLSFGHGYFVVRNLSQEQIEKVSHQDARLLENQFFERKQPWASVSPDIRSRLGTSKLQSFLSRKLAEQITKTLPGTQKEISTRLEEINEQLKQYPEPPQNAMRIIYDIVSEFSANVRNELAAEYPCIDWQNRWEHLQTEFFDALMDLKPTLTTSGDRDKGIYSPPGCSASNVMYIIDSDEEENEDDNGDVSMSNAPNSESPSKKRKAEATPAPSPSKHPRTPSKHPHTPSKHPRTPSKHPRTPHEVGIPDYSEKRTRLYLDILAEKLTQRSKQQASGQIDPRVINAEMLTTLTHWELPLNEFFNLLGQQLEMQLKISFEKSFKRWEGTALYASAWDITLEMLSLNLHQQRTTMAVEALEDEKKGPYLFHKEIFGRDKGDILQSYKQARSKSRLAVYKKERELQTGKPMTVADGERLKKDEKVMHIINDEPYSQELDVAAQMTTYYIFAARRFHDSICMRIESKFFEQLRTQLRDELETRLGIHDEVKGHEIARGLLAEQSQRGTQRRVLLERMKALRQGQQILADLESKKYDDGHASQATSTGTATGSANSSGMRTPLSEEMEEV